MDVKDNVRQRRRERLKAIAEVMKQEPSRSDITQGTAYPRQGSPYGNAVHPHPHPHPQPQPQPQPPGFEYEAAQDPELAWKLREKQMGWRWADPTTRRSQDEQNSWKEWSAPPSSGQFRVKLVLCCLLFAAVWGLFQLRTPWAETGQQWVRQVMQKDMDFQAWKVWYQEHFAGAPSFLPAFGLHRTAQSADDTSYHVPAKGQAEPATVDGMTGVLVKTKPGVTISAAMTGRVIFAGQRQGSGYTIIVQHASGLTSTYGMLGEGTVRLNDWVKGGQVIGSVSNGTAGNVGQYFFALKRKTEYVNAADVIAFD